MGIFKDLLRKIRPASPVIEKPSEPDLIQVYDQYGRKVHIARDQWRTNVLPANLKSNWQDADALYDIIVQSLNDGFSGEVVEASRRLHEIDPQPMRGATILGIVLMKEGQLDEAEKILRNYISVHGEAGVVLTNLAKVHSERGDAEKSEKTLWHALELDPNLENAMEWYAAIYQERGGQKAYLDALERVAALPNSWRALLGLARHALSVKDLDQATMLYRKCLDRAPKPIPADVLMQISGDLGNAGYPQQIIPLVEPYFDLAHHGLLVGNNLIKAHLESGEINSAGEILQQLYSLKRPDWEETLSYWDTQIAEARLSPHPPEPFETNMLLTEGPVWLAPGSAGSEIFPIDKAGAVKICFLGSSAEDDNPSRKIEHQLADTRGRLARAIPLFLAEQIHFNTNAAVQTLVPWVGNRGFALVGMPWTDEDAAKCAGQSDYVVTTHLKCQNEPWLLETRLIRVSDGQCLGTLSSAFSFRTPETAIPVLSNSLVETLQQQAIIRIVDANPNYAFPTDAHFPFYLLRLEQLLAVRSGCRDGVPPNFLSGERKIISGNIELCLSQPENITTRILLAKTLLAMKSVRADVASEFKDKISLLQMQHKLPEPAQTVVQKIFDGIFRD